MTKSPNKHNGLYVISKPFDEKLIQEPVYLCIISAPSEVMNVILQCF